MGMGAHDAVSGFLRSHGFDAPESPTLPDLDVAERDVRALGLALRDLATALGLECGVDVGRSLFSPARGMVQIREKLAVLRAAVALASVELGIPEKHLACDPAIIELLGAVFLRARQDLQQTKPK